MDQQTTRAYERSAEQWIAQRTPRYIKDGSVARFARQLRRGDSIADLGCGPGWYGAWLSRAGHRVVAIDAAQAMLVHAMQRSRKLRCVRADLAALPFRHHSFDAAWAANCYQHVPRMRLPMALAHLHWSLRPGAPLFMTLPRLDSHALTAAERRRGETQTRFDGDPLEGRLFARYSAQRAYDLLAGAGFTQIEIDAANDPFWMTMRAQRALSLPDLVGPRLRVLMCGLNPSVYSAQRGVGFARPGNRFWPAARAAGLIERERDPLHAFARGVGMTDLVKRATANIDELRADEYAAGLQRVEALVRLYKPRATCFVGLDGWRRCVDRRAQVGWIADGFGGRPAYLMPSTSGRNAHARITDLVAHLQRALGSPETLR